MSKQTITYGGFCTHCQTRHSLPCEPVLDEAKQLIAELEESQTIQHGSSIFSTKNLFGKARGQMFGVMLARDKKGKTHLAKAFSGQFNGHYQALQWVPPLFNVEQFHRINAPEEQRIKALTTRLAQTTDPQAQHAIRQERRMRSQTLMKKIHDLYVLRNFKGEQQPLSAFFQKTKGIPTGAGDCCAPKLIQHAINHNLTPLGIAEFFFGHPNKSNTRQHGHFYSSCTSNCAPILGFMLCGLM